MGEGDKNFYELYKLREDYQPPSMMDPRSMTNISAGENKPLPSGERSVREILIESPELQKYAPYDLIDR